MERLDALIATHQWADVQTLAGSVLTDDSTNVTAMGGRALAAAESGDRAGALRFAAKIADVQSRSGTNPTQEWRAAIASALGDKAMALAELERGYPGGAVPNYSWHNTILYELMRDYAPFQEYIRSKG